MAEDWCDLCELPLETCVHGMPAPVAKAPPAPRKRTPTQRRRSEPSSRRPDTGVTVRHTARQLTPSTSYQPHILAVLEQAGGAMDSEPLLDAVHERMEQVLVDGDHETVNGELRWKYAARQARAAMTRDGLLAPPRQQGRWELSPA